MLIFPGKVALMKYLHYGYTIWLNSPGLRIIYLRDV